MTKGGFMNFRDKRKRIKNSFFRKSLIQKEGFPLSEDSFLRWKKRQNRSFSWKKSCLFGRAPFLFNKKGQGLIEYLILIALMGVATIAIVRTLNQTVKSRFANAIYALQGRNQKVKTHSMKKEEYQRSDLSNFMSGSASSEKKSKPRKKW